MKEKNLLSTIIICIIATVFMYLLGYLHSEAHKTFAKNNGTKESNHNQIESKIEKIKTLHIEDRLRLSNEGYLFNGFINEDTLSFERLFPNRTYKIYQPAKLGYKFRLEGLKTVEIEIIEINREKGYIKLRLTYIRT